MAAYHVTLHRCPEEGRDQIAGFLGKAFSLKDSTCGSIAASTPIVLLNNLTREEAAAAFILLRGLSRLGAEVEFTTEDRGDLPKIDWPKRPLLFKRDLAEHIADLQMTVRAGGASVSLLDLIQNQLLDGVPETGGSLPTPLGTPISEPPRHEFRGIQLPEITPFSNPVLPPSSQEEQTPDPMSRLNELFPENDTGFIPNNQDISSILNRLLPDEPAGAPPGGRITPTGTPINGASPPLPAGYAVFLAKIADEARRAKAVPLIAELAKISTEEAETLSKKVIIPVLKGVSKEEAESAKQKFAKISILARVKAPE